MLMYNLIHISWLNYIMTILTYLKCLTHKYEVKEIIKWKSMYV